MGLFYSTPEPSPGPSPTMNRSTSTSTSTATQPSITCKRIQHFREWLTRFQGHACDSDKPIPEDIVNEIRKKLCSSSPLKDRDTLTPNSIKRWLKDHIDMSNIYQDRIHEILRLCSPDGVDWVPNFTKQQQSLLIVEFEKFSNAYDIICPYPTCFMVYTYLIVKLCDTNGITVQDRMQQYCKPKNMQKLVHFEDVCKNVYQYLGWEFKPWKID